MRFLSSFFSPFRALLTRPARWIGLPRRFLGLSPPGRVAFLVAVALIGCLFGYGIYAYFQEELSNLLEGRWLYPTLFLMVALPTAAYFTTKVWLEVESSVFPDIDAAWNAGVQALGKAGIDLTNTPLYLVVGVNEANAANTLMHASGWELVVEGAPDGAAPLRWFASRDAVVVFCLDTSAMSLCHAPVAADKSAPHSLRSTMVADGGGTFVAPSTGIRGTIVATASQEDYDAPVKSNAPVSIKGTMVSYPTGDRESSSMKSAEPDAAVSRKDLAHHSERLGRVCQLARQARQPYCPINGVMAVVAWKNLASSATSSIPLALRDDVKTILEHSKLHAPILLLVSGMETEVGFTELVKRVGEERAQGNRFGHGFNHQISPSKAHMEALAADATGAFEAWVYDLFRHPDCLTRSNNDKLFALLCRIRSQVQPRLTDLLIAFSESIPQDQERSMLLGGCYFASTGHGKSRQAFVPSVMSKLVELQEDLQWTDDALRDENRYRTMVQTLMFLNGLLIVFIVGLILYRFFGTSN